LPRVKGGFAPAVSKALLAACKFERYRNLFFAAAVLILFSVFSGAQFLKRMDALFKSIMLSLRTRAVLA
jgi:hypothetical protein